jgi:hypothetical protein
LGNSSLAFGADKDVMLPLPKVPPPVAGLADSGYDIWTYRRIG